MTGKVPTVAFNENDEFCVAWLKELFPGSWVDRRDIQKVSGLDLERFRRVHLFGGIGGWEHALKLAGWPEERPVWTGSCPCQPFSSAGKRRGTRDPRHLWPQMRRLIDQCRPPAVFGEQVASQPGRQWVSGVRADLEDLGYAVGVTDLCAAGAGAPHIRQRLFWVAVSKSEGSGKAGTEHSEPPGRQLQPGRKGVRSPGRVDDSSSERHRQWQGLHIRSGESRPATTVVTGSGPNGFWSEFDLIPCRDGKVRRVEPGTFPLAHGVPARVGRLRGYGNAIVPQVAAVFIRSFLEAEAMIHAVQVEGA